MITPPRRFIPVLPITLLRSLNMANSSITPLHSLEIVCKGLPPLPPLFLQSMAKTINDKQILQDLQ